ncbi:MAG: PKD domain-containing protein, partial [Humibacter sp.]
MPAALIASFALAQPAFADTPSSDNALGAKIASVALSQVGNGDNPVVTGFGGLNCNPYTTMVAGFSANSNGCGNDSTFNVRDSNENWCADFVKWVWQQAGITQDMNTINAAASSFVQWALDDGQTPAANTGTPVVGDAVVFFHAGAITPARYADHVGIVVAVHPDGTVDMVNGDFSSSVNVKVEHDVNLDLTAFAHKTWSSGEVWTLVSPPTAAQHANPQASISGPDTAVVGTNAVYHASGSEEGGSMTGYYWMFGDGRATNSNGADVTHTFATPGMHTISLTATSSFGTITTITKNVNVVGASASVAAVPSTDTWYSSYPLSYYRFVRASSGLAADVWDGASWLQLQTAGTPASTGAIASLAYSDPEVNSATTPHAYYRAQDGSLAETYLGSTGWVSATLPGTPAEGADVVAVYGASGPEVFFVDGSGHLNETSEQSGTWSTA